MSELAIVIPAYKSMYFNQTLLSIANQTSQDFTLYIGNDSSPHDIKTLVDSYQDRIHIVYKHFDENLGGKDLVAHWERCIDLVNNENWIWLFSDDDTMDPTCVENFYLALKQYQDFDLFHFNVQQIDEYENIIEKFPAYPKIMSSEEFLKCRLQGEIYSFVVEYVFKKSYFFERGRFQHFDLAWGSDDATWIKLAKKKGIKTIENTNVYWRVSPFNISPNFKDKDILAKKYNAQIEFADWIFKQAKQNEIQIQIIPLKQQLKKWFLRTIKVNIKVLSINMIITIFSKLYLTLENQNCPKRKIAFLYTFKIYYSLKEMFKKILFWKYFKLQRLKLITRFKRLVISMI